MLAMKTRGLTETQKAMVQRAYGLGRMAPAHKRAAVQLYGWVQRNFQAEGKLHEDAALHWPGLSQKTIKQRQAKGFWPGRILQQRGRLVGGFDITANNERGRVENRVIYSVQHEAGNPARHLPRRKIFPTVEQGKKIVLPVYQQYVKEVLR